MNNGPLQINWDINNKKEIEEAKQHFIKAKNSFRAMEDENGTIINHWSEIVNKGYFKIKETYLKDTQLSMRILNETGDETIIWDINNLDEVKEAGSKFQEYLDKGWRAFAIDPQGKKHRRILNFNPQYEEITFEEGAKSKLKKFIETFRKIEVTPKTRPG